MILMLRSPAGEALSMEQNLSEEMLETLPLGREHLMSFELVPLGPLTPLRQLLPAHPQ